MDRRWGCDADTGILVAAERQVVKRAPLWIRGNLPRPHLILQPPTPDAFSIEESIINFLQFTLEFKIVYWFFYVYLWTRHNGRVPKSKQAQQNIAPLGMFNSRLPRSMTRSLNLLKPGWGQMHQAQAETQINSIFLLVFPSLSLLSQ